MSQYSASASITSAGEFVETDYLTPGLKETADVAIVISGTFVATVSLQVKRPDETTWKTIKQYTGSPQTDIVTLKGFWNVRLGVAAGDYTSGTVEVDLS